MFNVSNSYSEELEGIKSNIEKKELGLQVLKLKEFKLPIKKYNFELEITKDKNLNIIEEFIIKVVLANFDENISSDFIADLLELDKIFVHEYIKQLIHFGIFDKNKLPNFQLTEEGLKFFKAKKMLMKDKAINVQAYIQPEFKIFYDNMILEKISEDIPILELGKNIEESSRDILSDKNIKDKIIKIAKSQKIIAEKKSINQVVSEIREVEDFTSDNIFYNRYIEMWIYNIIDDKLYCRVWDRQTNAYNEIIANYIKVNKPLNKEDFDEKLEEDNSKPIPNENIKKIEIEYIKEIKEAKEIQENKKANNKKLTMSTKNTIRMVRGKDIKQEFNNCLKSVKKYMFIASPWITEQVVDKEMINTFKNIVKKDGVIYIVWGISKDYSNEDRKPSENLLNTLRNIKDENGLSGVFVYWIGNHHTKEIIVDEKIHLAGSFNWLSYRGDYLPRGESVYIVNDKASVKNSKLYWEEIILKKLKEIFNSKDYLNNVKSLLNLQLLGEEAFEYLEKIINYTMAEKGNDKYDKLFNIMLVCWYNNSEKVLVEIMKILLSNNKHVEEVFMILNDFKKNNRANLYNNMMLNYRDIFVKNNLVNEKNNPIKKYKNIKGLIKFK
ncbi:hypothetical protein [Clostridium tarantellae]|uniref:PLD phosphodiesterase domain-containing protein n=1 Tax=Clostridium tarantellae TaxID=39493 RepID=A0A6I1MNN3_9CLOT|nr:hypothetical protein [Clostridium tarantellae]MPQ42511.1 hypothetical protein [Clostridium tarantellae]